MLVRMAESTRGGPTLGIHVDHGAAIERIDLDATSWVDVAGDGSTGADELFDRRCSAGWRGSSPGCSATTTGGGAPAREPDGSRATHCRIRPWPRPTGVCSTLWRAFDGFGMMQYRDGRDGQAFHRDTDMRWLDDTVIAVLTLGARRPWLLRPRTNRYDHPATRVRPRHRAGVR